MRIEGIQVVRNEPIRAPRFDSQHSELRAGSASDAVGTEVAPKRTKRPLDTLPNITSGSGCDLELCLIERGHDAETDFGLGNWLMDSFRLGVGEPVCYFIRPFDSNLLSLQQNIVMISSLVGGPE